MPISVVHRASDGKPPEGFVAVMSRICRQCGRYVEGGHLKCCRGCRAARYCSSKCQRAAWKAHATACMSTKVRVASVQTLSVQCALRVHYVCRASTLIYAAASGACLRTPTWHLFTSSIATCYMRDTVMLTYWCSYRSGATRRKGARCSDQSGGVGVLQLRRRPEGRAAGTRFWDDSADHLASG